MGSIREVQPKPWGTVLPACLPVCLCLGFVGEVRSYVACAGLQLTRCHPCAFMSRARITSECHHIGIYLVLGVTQGFVHFRQAHHQLGYLPVL